MGSDVERNKLRVDERRRISRELHDRVGHEMALALQHLDLHKYFLGTGDERSERELDAGVTSLDEAFRAVRSLSSELRGLVGKDGIRASIETYLHDHVPGDIETSLEVTGEASRLSQAISEELYLIMREACRNALRHGQPAELHLTVSAGESEVTGTVRDNGRGFRIGSPDSPPGGGMASMTDRVKLLNGTLEVVSAIGQGTTVTARIPAGRRQVTAAPGRSAEEITVALADDHTLFREGLREILATDSTITIIGEAADSYAATTLAIEHRPDVLLLDVEMPGLGAPAVIRTVKQSRPDVKIIVLTMHDDADLVQDLLGCGATAYLVKSIRRDELIAAIHSVACRPDAVLVSVSRQSIEFAGGSRDPRAKSVLTARESEVLQLMAEAFRNAQIAAKLNITEATVKRHLTNVYAKLDAVSRVDAIKKATEANLIVPGRP